MSQDRDSISRAQLIGGMIATGALAACGRGPNPTPLPLGPRYGVPPKRALVNEIFADPVFKDLDKVKLAEIFDPSTQIEANARVYFAHTGRQPQTSKVIRHIPRSGIAIQSPGRYTFADDILWNPYDVASAAITIQSSNVTLDLAGFTLKASIPDKELQIAGILVAPPIGELVVSNVTITNGTVANASEYGIAATSVIGLKVSRITVTGVSMQNLQIRNLTPAGIYVAQSVNVAISQCRVTDLTVRTDSSAGILLTNTSQATVSGCRVSRLVNNDGAVQGFSCIQCISVTTTGCTAESLQTHFNGNVLTSGHTVLGFVPILCLNLSYVDCSASRLIGCCDDCHGMSVFLDGQVTVTRFRAEHVVDGVSPSHSGAKATGIEVYGTNITVTDSAVNLIKAINPQDRQATGFSAWGKAITFTRCKASNVTVQGNLVTGARAEGFGWAPDPRPEFAYLGAYDVTYRRCVAENCQVGFDTWYHVDSTWIRPVHKNCERGILIQPKGKRTLSCDPCSECILPITANLTNIASGNTIVR
jgi:hypothetical protein